MGLGKTVQSMAFPGHMAERYGVWGPFLIIAPAWTLHKWQHEFKRFVPRFKVVPYWGTPQERKILRQFWQNSNLHTEDASFHVVVTSYQFVMSDITYFNSIKWQFLVLDEAQAIKSSSRYAFKISCYKELVRSAQFFLYAICRLTQRSLENATRIQMPESSSFDWNSNSEYDGWTLGIIAFHHAVSVWLAWGVQWIVFQGYWVSCWKQKSHGWE